MMRSLLLCLLLFPMSATPLAAAVIRLAGAPPAYRLEAAGLAQVAAIDLTISYDAAALAMEGFDNGPFVQGAMIAANLGASGATRIGIITTATLNGSGLIGTLRVRTLDSALPRLALQAVLRDADGKLLPVTTELPYLAPPAASSPAVNNPAPPSGSGNVSPRPMVSGMPVSPPLPLPAGQVPAASPTAERRAPPPQSPVTARSSDKSGRDAAAPAKDAVTTGTPQRRFAKALATIKSLDDLARILALPRDIRQTPFPALSDGKTQVTVSITDSRQEKPAIAVQNARLLWSGAGDANAIEIDLLPHHNSDTVGVVVVDQKQREIKLVVAPPLVLDPQRTTSDYLAQWQDLDGDGQITIDEAYLLAVNLLAQRRPANASATGQLSANGEKGL